ncbi:hypothetical protein dsmv_0172 [Desulfococcus multivorans DSM 2059]|uniref:Uncharacterized protein n=1 Tax=Desulfococcus multivorans DSM 2059 TaxID=1121405 RepID=S7TNM2_DESML|nr:uncharacterized protein Dmul_09050 [Desulfococcus multivorans]EPR38762.1 hypothetical protein dsmv_0172 [Desulfococcus multivorans DSM 2059]SJZ78731.1 hypothetical protein SAMN02745446_01662 [Desulfococcus multivorans DSM 2059]
MITGTPVPNPARTRGRSRIHLSLLPSGFFIRLKGCSDHGRAVLTSRSAQICGCVWVQYLLSALIHDS